MERFQVIDVVEYDDDSLKKYIIAIFCIDENGKSYCIKVQNYEPFFYINFDSKYKIEDYEDIQIGKKYKKSLSRMTTSIKKSYYKKLENYQKEKEPFLKLSFNSLRNFGQTKKTFEDKVKIKNDICYIKRYESNISPYLRFFHEKNINLSSWIKIKNKDMKRINNENERLSRCTFEYDVDYKKIENLDINKIGPLKVLSFDIECTSEDGSFPQYSRNNDKIIQIGTTVETFGKGSEYDYNFIVSLKECDNIENTNVINCKDELEMIKRWCEEVKRIDPDIITGYNIWGFDYEYIYERTSLLIKTTNDLIDDILNISRIKTGSENGYINSDAFSDNQKLYNIKHLSSSAMGDNILKYLNISGRVNIDLLKYVRDNKKLPMYKLDYVAEKFLGQNKNPVTPNDIFNWYHEGKKEKITDIAKYCIQDCKLVNKLVNKMSVIENSIGMANTCWVPLNYIFTRGQGIKAHSLVLKECSELGYIVPHKNKTNDNVDFKGATVLTAKSGIHYYPVSALDFASLYPSSMISHNLCISSFISEENLNEHIKKYKWSVDKYRKVEWNEDGIIKKYFYVQPDIVDGKIVEEDRAVLPQILLKLLNKRNETKKIMSNESDSFKKSILDGLQLAYKVTANSIYGQLGSAVGPIGKVEVAASITTTGRQLLELAQNFVLTHYHGSTAIYGDSVQKDTPVLLKHKDTNNIEILQIDDLFDIDNNKKPYEELKPFDTIQSNRREKEQNTSNYLIWTSEGWCNIKRVIRHKCNKKIFRINTHTSCVDVTEDHSLLDVNKQKIKSNEVDLNTELLQNYPLFDKNNNDLNTILDIINKNIEDIKLQKYFLYGFFFGDGSCGKYDTKYGIKYSWALNNQNKKLLEKLQVYIKNNYNLDTKILETMDSSHVYKLVPCKNIKEITMEYRQLFYNKDKYKIVPNKILNEDYLSKLYFFAGYYAADGHKCNNQLSKNINFSNKGKIGTAQLYYLLKSIGFSCSLNCRKDKLNIYRINATIKKLRKKENKIKKIIDLGYTDDYVYDIEIEEEHHNFQAGIGDLIVSNTDSIFVKFDLKRHRNDCLFHKDNIEKRKEKYHKIKEKICKEMELSNEDFLHSREATAMMKKTDFRLYEKCKCEEIPDLMSEEALKESIRLACEVDSIITDLLPDHKIFNDKGKQIGGCQQLEYEKTYLPYILFTKKRYVGKLFEHKTDLEKDWYLDYKGIVLKRRDNADIVKKFYKKCLMKIMEGDKSLALKYLEDSLNELMNNDNTKIYPIEDFVLSKTLKGLDKYKYDKKVLQTIMLLNKILIIKKELNNNCSTDILDLIINNQPINSNYTYEKIFETCNHISYDMTTGLKKLNYKMSCEKCNNNIKNHYGINQILDYLNNQYNSKSTTKQDRDIIQLMKYKSYKFDNTKSFDIKCINILESLLSYYNSNTITNMKKLKVFINKITPNEIYKELLYYEIRKRNMTHVILANKMKERDAGSAPQINERVQYCFIQVKGDEKKYLQGDLVESPDYILKNNIKINYNYYIEKQLEKPLLQLFSFVDIDKSKQIFSKIKVKHNNNKNGHKNIFDFLK